VWLQTELEGIVGSIGVVTGVVTTRHSYLPCQLVLVCTGSEPSAALANACTPPLATGRGIVVNERLATSVPAIYAAGDVAALKNPWTARHEPRAQWAAAVEQGRLAAAVLTGQAPHSRVGLFTPWHATALGDLSLLTVGMPFLAGGAEALVHEDEGGYYRLTVDGERLVGYLALAKHPPDGAGIKRLFDEGVAWSEAAEALLTGTFDAQSFFLNRHTSFLLQQESNPRLPAQPAPIPQEHRWSRSALLSGTGALGQPRGRREDGARFAHRPWPQLEQEVSACIGCNECLLACPALEGPIAIDVLNRETLSGPRSPAVMRFAQTCFQCGACVAPCPVGLHRDAMMLWMRVCLLRREEEDRQEQEVLYART
jgi:ferredoxin